jgi:nucleoside-diphosphate-sugar epimerase
MRIVITGNMGYIGPVVVKHLKETLAEIHITGVDTGYFKHCLTNADLFPDRLIDVQLYKDVRELDSSVLDGADALVQLAAVSNDPIGQVYQQVTHDINCAAAVRLAGMARDAGVGRVVIASSCSVYGHGEDHVRSETSTVEPLTAYAKSKLDLELAVRRMATEDFQITSLRFPTACGVSSRLRLDLVLNDFVASALANGRIDILSDGTPWRPLIDTRDMARSIEWALQRSKSGDVPFLAVNAGRDDSNYQIRQLAESVKQIIPGVDIATNHDASPDNRSYRVDFSRYAALAPNHQPQVSLQQSIQDIWDALHQANFADRNFRNSDRIRLNVIAAHRSANRLDSQLRWTS